MKIGSQFKIQGQPYRVVAAQDYWSAAGRCSELVVLGAPCADCGSLFRFATTRAAERRRHVNRRCPHHHRPAWRCGRRSV
jgi:hypothetical protein